MKSKLDSNNKKKSGILKTFEEILSEDPEAIANVRSEKAEPDDITAPPHKTTKFKQRCYAIFGVLLTFFAIIGFISSCKFAAHYFHRFTTGETFKDDLTDVIYPAVIMDISEFSSASELSSDQIISASLWSLVMSGDDMEKYEANFDVISVPEIDVESYAAKLFGGELPPLTHSTVGSGELTFYYNEQTKSYNVPTDPVTFTYVPDIKSISKDGTSYTVIVDYLKEIPAWMEENPKFSPRVSKTVEFKLQESDNTYKILSVSVLNVNSK